MTLMVQIESWVGGHQLRTLTVPDLDEFTPTEIAACRAAVEGLNVRPGVAVPLLVEMIDDAEAYERECQRRGVLPL